ncbi:MAG: peptidase E [Candidatus Pacebacteria bacterium]|jgi:dipeptidase E|nr:peptidase E [Candidatus Paceibacterota bacterium]
MKLLLTSAGLVPETKEAFVNLLGKKPEYVRLVFIPTAANPELDRWYLNKDKLRLAELGINMVNEVDIEKETKETLAPKIANADVIYVEGGNTFYLMKYARESGFETMVKEFLDKGGVYVGVSAGSMIAGINIETGNWKHADKNIVDLKDLSGMNLVNLVVAPHIDETNIEATREEAAKVAYPVVALSDKQAILVDGGKIEIIGPGDRMVFNSPKILTGHI